MLKIGEFAKMCGASVQTLRYYDQIGVFCADYIDPDSGYRYYSRDKLKTFALIEQLKQLDFSLDEIKEFLACTPAQQCRIYRDKKDAIMKGIHQKHKQIGQIDQNCQNTQPGVLPFTVEMLRMPFEDDPCVIGKWSYCGNLEKGQVFDSEQILTKTESAIPETLFFIPGGCYVWMYFWSKGYLYYLLPEFNVIAPCPYHIFKVGDTTYMQIDWMVDILVGSSHECTVRIYKQEDAKEYTERETRIGRDKVDVPFIADERAIGKWETVDLILDPNSFNSKKRYWQGDFWIVDMQFFARGVCSQTRRAEGGLYQKILRHSAGVVLDTEKEFAQHYRIFTENDTDYLIMEHKSGDYSYGGKIYCYYVFRRKTT